MTQTACSYIEYFSQFSWLASCCIFCDFPRTGICDCFPFCFAKIW